MSHLSKLLLWNWKIIWPWLFRHWSRGYIRTANISNHFGSTFHYSSLS